MTRDTLYASIHDQVCKMPVIDTHEHLCWDEASAYRADDDVLREYLSHYLKSDVISAGLKPDALRQVLDAGRPVGERWRIVEPYWEASRYTGYGRALDLSVRAIYGIDGVHAGTIEALNEAFLAQRKPGHYRYVLGDLCGIEKSLLDVWTFQPDGANDLFVRVWQPQNFIMPSEPEGQGMLSSLEAKYGDRINGLDDWQTAFEKELDATLAKNGARVLKSAIAYSRSLRFEHVDYATAKQLFAGVLAKWRNDPDALPVFPVALQDYMMHYTLRLAGARNLTFQIHTGLLEGNGNCLTNSDPSLLNNLFAAYPDVDFDLFHIGYPYQNVASALCKMFPNVYLDMCWAHIISPSACVTALHDFLDAVPFTKISAFGGDYLFADGVYGHLLLSRQNVSRVLADKVACGIFGEEKAIEIAHALFYDNPKRIFKL